MKYIYIYLSINIQFYINWESLPREGHKFGNSSKLGSLTGINHNLR